jgi:hypothetical protein
MPTKLMARISSRRFVKLVRRTPERVAETRS